MSLSRAEKETIVRFSEDPEEPLTVYTYNKGLMERMKRLKATLKRVNKIEGREVAWTFECPREWFKKPGKPPKGRPGGNPEALAKARAAGLKSGGKTV